MVQGVDGTTLKAKTRFSRSLLVCADPELMFTELDKHYPSRFGQTSLATAVTKFTKPVTKNYFGPSTIC